MSQIRNTHIIHPWGAGTDHGSRQAAKAARDRDAWNFGPCRRGRPDPRVTTDDFDIFENPEDDGYPLFSPEDQDWSDWVMEDFWTQESQNEYDFLWEPPIEALTTESLDSGSPNASSPPSDIYYDDYEGYIEAFYAYRY